MQYAIEQINQLGQYSLMLFLDFTDEPVQTLAAKFGVCHFQILAGGRQCAEL